ncbi:AAA family ATPase [Shewanella sp. MSW]|uniref:AAA family ATPase n=1 Tax=Shewanella sp. MSW TaxID=2569536 RepID=UPI001186F609|nr:AAA family ATPase [Shewanella sp. MSW]TVP13133.1 ABC transporter ATP-binding protein [Shewanella sp. MSW]
MFKVTEVKINNFWYRADAYCTFNKDVNIIIGKNGTGKTTFMNILHSALNVDLDALIENDFDQIEIKLNHNNKQKTIKVKKESNKNSQFAFIDYFISNKKYSLRTIITNDIRIGLHYKKRAMEVSSELRKIISSFVSLASLSVYRLRGGDEIEVFDKKEKKLISPVDFRLSQLTSELTQYQLELGLEARNISISLQKDVLASILYTDSELELYIPNDFERAKETHSLVTAYKRLNAMDRTIKNKITKHVDAIDMAVEQLRTSKNKKSQTKIDFAALEAFVRTRKIIEMSLAAEEKTNKVFSQIELFISILKEFIPDKKFHLDAGGLTATNLNNEEIELKKLSSGEKQLLILLIETLLQRSSPFIFLTDEPEISLHIEWQRKIIPAVRQLNPEAQVIAATHSPEVASKYRSYIKDMKGVVNVR